LASTYDHLTKVLGGRGSVGMWLVPDRLSGKWFYRERDKARRTYRYKQLIGATNVKQAEAMAAEAAIALATEHPPAKSTSPPDPVAQLRKQARVQERLLAKVAETNTTGIPVEQAIKEFVRHHSKRRDAEVIAEMTFLNKRGIVENHLTPYLHERKVHLTSQLTRTTFDEYLAFRSKTTRLVQQRECSVIGEWLRFLDKHEYIDAKLLRGRSILPKVEVRMTDRMANPAINPDDWKTIVNYVRNEWRNQAAASEDQHHMTVRRWFYRNLFWHYILFSKNTGMSPEEVLKLKWRNVEIRDVGRISMSKREQEYAELEAEGIDVLGEDKDYDPTAWAQEHEFGREERLIAYVYTIRSKTQEAREIPCNQGRELRRWMKFVREYMAEHGLTWKITGDTPVFANPWNEMKPVHKRRMQQSWREVVDHLQNQGQLKGHRFSDHRYTLYSMRSTFIEDHLLKGTDLFLLARIAGHDVKELMKSYERLDIRSRAKEITDIQYGKQKEEAKVIDLLKE